MNKLEKTRKPVAFVSPSPTAASAFGTWDGRIVLPLALLTGMASALPGLSLAQQTADREPDTATQMPQAPRAPTVESIAAQSEQAARQSAHQAPDITRRLSLELQQADGQDTNNTLQRDTGHAELQLSFGLEQQWSELTRLVGRLELSTRYFTEQELNDSDEEFSYDLERLFVDITPGNDVLLRAGRQGIDDPMEAIVDEDLDGIALTYRKELFELAVSHTREDWFEASTVTVQDDITNTMATLQITPNKDTLWMPYLLQRSTSGDASRTWIGFQGIVEPDNSAWRYWIHASALDGDDATPAQTAENGEIIPADTRDVGGQSVDLGINWNAGGALKATYTVAIAHASGGQRKDRFRQSGLHDNDFALNGKNTFRYLGEVLDPELTNIQILTLGMGVELSSNWQADLALHTYEQLEAEDQLRGSDIEYEPEGTSKDLGTAADFVISYERDSQLQILGTVGAFMPGSAFDDTRDTAWIARAELEYRF